MIFTRYQILRALIVVVFILPMFYEYFTILPSALKYLMDVILFGYFILYRPAQRNRDLRRASGFQGSYLFYISIVLILSLYSVITHNESMVYWFQEFRRLTYPWLFYIIFTDLAQTDANSSIKLHRLMALMFLIQIPVTLFQRVFYAKLWNSFLFSGSRYIAEIDFAMGTIGAGGATFLGVLIPMAMLYFYDLKLFKYALMFLLPLIIVNSGGGVVLAVVAAMLIILYIFFTKPFSMKFRIILASVFMAGLFVIMYSIPFFQDSIDKYAEAYVWHYENQIEEDRETFKGQEHKVDRINGYKFLNRHMSEARFEHLLGLGFSFKENKNGTLPYQLKSDLNYIIADRGYVGLATYVIFIVIFMSGTIRMLRIQGYDEQFVKLIYFIIFFAAGLYNASTRSLQLWMMFVYLVVLFEHREQYFSLTSYLNADKYNRRRSKRGLQVETMS